MPPDVPDFALVNARIWTGRGPQVEALAARDGRITCLGRTRDIAPLINSNTRVLDACGRRVVPGLADAHLHFIPGGLRLTQLDLCDAQNSTSFIDLVRAQAARVAAGEWLLGGGWSEDRWPDRTPPRSDWIDAACGQTPAFLLRFDCHAALVNSAALALARIDHHGPADPPGGGIDRDPHTRAPTGILRDTAMELVRRHIPRPNVTQRMHALEAATRLAWSHGITMVHNMLDLPDVPVVAAAAAEGRLGVRMYGILHTRPTPDTLKVHDQFAPGDDRFRIGACKNYMDGSLGSRTAWMLQPYLECSAAAPRGLRVDGGTPGDELLEELVAADQRGVQLCAHAIGDAANRELLNLFAAVARRNGHRDRRPRVEHAQHLDASDVSRFANVGAVASMQPLHKYEDGMFAERALGKDRAAGAYRFRDLQSAGVVLAFGSDWPIVSLNPWLGVAAAVTGRVRGGEVWLPSQSLTVAEALRAYTSGPAHACHMEDRLGVLAPGYLADMALLDRDVLAVPHDEISQVRADATIIGGRVVYERG